MASYYVDSNAGGAGTGADWANAFTTMATALSGKSAGDIFYVAHNHSESTAGSVTLTFPGTVALPNLVYCVDSGGSVPPVAADLRTTGSIATTANNSITINGSFYMYGLKFTAGNSTGSPGLSMNTATTGSFQSYKACTFILGSTGAAVFSAGLSTVSGLQNDYYDCTFTLSSTGNTFSVLNSNVTLKNCIIGGAVNFPATGFFTGTASRGAKLLIEGCDLSTKTSGAICNGSIASIINVIIKDCKLGAGVTPISTVTNNGNLTLDLINSDEGDTNYRVERYRYPGTMTTETTVVRDGGAGDGTNNYSWKVVTSANTTVFNAFECPPIVIWNDTTGSEITATVEGIWGDGSVPDDNEIWIEFEYQGTSGFPLALRSSDGQITPLHTVTAQTASSETWGGGTTAFKLSSSFTPEEKGPIYAYVRCGAASSTFYIDPKITIS